MGASMQSRASMSDTPHEQQAPEAEPEHEAEQAHAQQEEGMEIDGPERLLDLPPELISHVLQFLDARSLARAGAACRQLRALAADDALWARLCEREAPPRLQRADLAPTRRALFAALYGRRRPVGLLLCETRAGLVLASPARGAENAAPGADAGAAPLSDEGLSLRILARVPDKRQIQQPSWSPDGRWVAYSEFASSLDFTQPNASRVVVAEARTGRTLAWAATPFPPFFFYWSPCSTLLTFLSNWRDRRVGMRAIDVGPAAARFAGRPPEAGPEELEPQTAMVGRPLFYSFCPDRFALASHTGDSQLALHALRPASCELAETVAVPAPSCFHGAPQWTPDGKAVLAAVEMPQPRGPPAVRPPARVTSRAGSAGRSGAPLRFAMDAACGHVAAVLRGPREGDGLLLLLPLGSNSSSSSPQVEGEERMLADPPAPGAAGPVAVYGPKDPVRVAGAVEAFFWSPDGRLLLYLEPDEGLAPLHAVEWVGMPEMFRWVVYEVATGRRQRYPPFVPSRSLTSHYLPFFDQYAQSARFWSPAGDAFCYARADGDAELGGAWVQEVDVGREGPPPPPRLVLPGAKVAFWAPV
eukprot:tig00000145_g8855.t1